ncbi:MAG: hypothetical protein Q8O67_32180 [Deltaproteobacteria bacterium]|nr:hypothetical protein [Deltaproteobacteria bacterium]
MLPTLLLIIIAGQAPVNAANDHRSAQQAYGDERQMREAWKPAAGGAALGVVVGAGAGIAAGVAASRAAAGDIEMAAAWAAAAAAMGLLVTTGIVVAIFPVDGLPDWAPFLVASSAVLGAGIVFGAAAASSFGYIRVAYAGSDCLCGPDVVVALFAPPVLAAGGAVAGAALSATALAFVE